MTQHPPVKILAKGWDRIETKFGKIPNDQHIEELIRIPQDGSYFLGIERFRERFLPQKYDPDNQRLARKFSNELIKVMHSQTVLDLCSKDCCDRHGFDFEMLHYFNRLTRWCESIFPTSIVETREVAKLIAKVKQNGFDAAELKFFELELSCYQKPYCLRFSGFNGSLQVQENFKRQCLQNSEERSLHRSAWLDMAGEAIKSRRKREKKYGVEPCLRQCFFCYRFTLKTGEFSRTCGDDKCLLADRNWVDSTRTYLDKGYGFDRYNNFPGLQHDDKNFISPASLGFFSPYSEKKPKKFFL